MKDYTTDLLSVQLYETSIPWAQVVLHSREEAADVWGPDQLREGAEALEQAADEWEEVGDDD